MATSTKASGLRDYNEVSQRVEGFNEKYPDGRIETEVVAHHVEIEDVIDARRGESTYRQPLARGYVIVRAKVFRKAEDTIPAGVGMSYMLIPGITQYTRDSEVENAETSAVGRALAFIGFYAKGDSLASRHEIAAKAGGGSDAPARRTTTKAPKPEAEGTGLTVSQRKKLFAALRENGLEGAPRKALVMMVTKKHSVTQMDSADLDKVLAVLDDPTDEANEGLIALAKDVETVGVVEDDD